MNFALLALLSLFAVTPSAHAFSSIDGTLIDLDSDQEQIMATATGIEVAEVPSQSDEVPANLKILGKGILNTDQNVSLAVACVGQPESEGGEATCNRLRVVEFDANRIPHWEGSAFEISNTQSFQVALKKEYRKKFRLHFLRVKKDIKRTKSVAKVYGNVLSAGLMVFLVAVWSAGDKGIVISSSVAGGLTIILLPIAVLIALQMAKVDVIGAMINGVLAPFRGLGNSMVMDGSYSMTAANGWNWAAQPTEVNNKKYLKIKALLADFASGAIKAPAN